MESRPRSLNGQKKKKHLSFLKTYIGKTYAPPETGVSYRSWYRPTFH
jgi:hypothetical protein